MIDTVFDKNVGCMY